ncbi:unnamed protein product, partial [Ectocarpus sp. 13 AM-2016]
MYFGPVPRRWAHRRRLRAVFDPRCEVLTMDVNLARRSVGSDLDRSLDPFSVAWNKGNDKPSRLRKFKKEKKKKKRTNAEGGGGGDGEISRERCNSGAR